MAGAAVRIDVKDEAVRAALARLRRRVKDLRPALDEIGESLETRTVRRFETQQGPDGVPWKPSYRAVRQRGQTLRDTGRLRDSITHRVSPGGDEVAIGTNVEYAAIHQFGGKTPPRIIRPRSKKALFWPGAAHPVKSVRHPGSEMPARPFLGVSPADERALLAIVSRRISEAWA